jgi:hypothetical protein
VDPPPPAHQANVGFFPHLPPLQFEPSLKGLRFNRLQKNVVVQRIDEAEMCFVMNVHRLRGEERTCRCIGCVVAYTAEYAVRSDNDLLDIPGQQSVRSFRFAHFGNECRWLDDPLDMARHNPDCLAVPKSLFTHICAHVFAQVLQRIDEGHIEARWAHMIGATQLLPTYLFERWPNLEIMRVSAHWQPYFRVRRHLYRIQQGHLPPIGDDLLNVLNMPSYASTHFGELVEAGHPEHGERFIRELRLAPSTIVIMLSPSAASHLGRCQMILFDGTFKVPPPGYRQLVNIIGWDPIGEYIAAGYVLMATKNQDDYEHVFSRVRQYIHQQHGGTLGAVRFTMSDHEQALTAALANVFGAEIANGQLTLKKCAFHYAKAIIAHVQRHNLIAAYRAGDVVVRTVIHELLGMPLCPPAEVLWLWQNHMRNAPPHQDAVIHANLQHFLNYYETEWMANAQRRARVDSYSTPAGLPITDNGNEGNNRGLNMMFRAPHPRCERLFYVLKGLDHMNAIRRMQVVVPGTEPRPSSNRYRDLRQRREQSKQRVQERLAEMRAANAPAQEVADMLRTHLRWCARLLGGGVHPNLVGDVYGDGDDPDDAADDDADNDADAPPLADRQLDDDLDAFVNVVANLPLELNE